MSIQPFSLLIKPASADCNLRCHYCFYYDKSLLYPQSSKHRMTDDVLQKLISSYMATPQNVYTFGWQGGEPTIMGLEFFQKVVDLQKKYGKNNAVVANGLQTNGTLIDNDFAKFLSQYKFLVGLSIDGPQDIHDKYRQTIRGADTFQKVMEGFNCLKRNHVEFNVLTLVSKANVRSAKKVYNFLRDNEVGYHQYIPCVEFDTRGNLMPFAITGEEWGNFLCELFDEWIQNDIYKVSIRLFDSILMFMVNGAYSICHMGGNCCQYFVVEHNGDIYPCDFFVEPQKRLGNVMQSPWGDIQKDPLYTSFGNMKNMWNSSCNKCEYLFYCSGDCLKHRIYNNNQPHNISWLCNGWKLFFEHSIPIFKELAYKIQREQNIKLFLNAKFERNEICFCGSGKKYKKCHGALL